jgi:hypothetical protein
VAQLRVVVRFEHGDADGPAARPSSLATKRWPPARNFTKTICRAGD